MWDDFNIRIEYFKDQYIYTTFLQHESTYLYAQEYWSMYISNKLNIRHVLLKKIRSFYLNYFYYNFFKLTKRA